MRMALEILLVPLLCGFVASCGKPAGAQKTSAVTDAGSDAAGTAATPANLTLTPAGAPQRRDGYWEMAAFTDSGTPITKQFLCVGAGSERKFSLFDQLALAGDCSKKDFTRTASGWTFETRCKVMTYETVQKGTISGDFQQTFRVDQAVTQTPSTTENKGSIRGRRVGDCPAKFRPGDLVDKEGDTLGNMLGS